MVHYLLERYVLSEYLSTAIATNHRALFIAEGSLCQGASQDAINASLNGILE